MRAALVMIFVGAFLFSACNPCDYCKQNKEDAVAQKAALDEEARELIRQIESMGAESDNDLCAAKLTACEERLTKCEKDPFTGTKYLTGDEEKKKK